VLCQIVLQLTVFHQMAHVACSVADMSRVHGDS